MGVDSLNAKTGCVLTRAPRGCNLLELIGLGVFLLLVVTVGFFWFFFFFPFLSFSLESLRWADKETASHLHRARPHSGVS